MGQYTSHILDQQQTISELRKENAFLRDLNTRKETQIHESTLSVNIRSSEDVPTDLIHRFDHILTEKRLSEIVDRFLTENNISYLPDIVERQLYLNIFRLIVNILNETIDNTKINILGHDVTMNMRPSNSQA